MSSKYPEKLSSLVSSLNLIPYFQAHPERTVFEAARDLGREPQEVLADLSRLHTSGVGTNPEELFDLTYSFTNVEIHQDQGLSKALRLTPTEAGTLLLTLESLENAPGLIDHDTVESTAQKLRTIMDDKAVAVHDSIAETSPGESEVQSFVAEALQEGKRLRCTYWSASSGRSGERTLDPTRLFLRDDDVYLIAWEREVGEHRTFRLDRMSEAMVLNERAEPHSSELTIDGVNPFGFTRRADLLIRTDASWLADYHDITLGDLRADGWVEANMPYGSREWFIRFCIGQADRISVVGPTSLAREVAERAQSGQKGYYDPKGSGDAAKDSHER